MALVTTHTCSCCNKTFCVVSSAGWWPVQTGRCQACRDLAEIDERWDGIDELIAFHEGSEVFERIQTYRTLSKLRIPLKSFRLEVETPHD